jgi:hypothetical protein
MVGEHAAGSMTGVHIDRERTGRLKYEIRKANAKEERQKEGRGETALQQERGRKRNRLTNR